MKRSRLLFYIMSITAAIFIVGCLQAKNPKVLLKTTYGNIVLELNQNKAPISVKNFIQYVKNGYYRGTIFHRVISNFMIQGGGYTQNLEKKQTLPAIKNEANNGLKNNRGTIAMARTSAIDSATAQFFINVTDNDFLNHKNTGRGYGYAVFGKVIKGMDVVDRIRYANTGKCGMFPKNCPTKTIKINDAVIINK